jgi:hypothetical protein
VANAENLDARRGYRLYSVTFVLDKNGVVRHFHPGGQYVQGDPAFADLREAIERPLAS